MKNITIDELQKKLTALASGDIRKATANTLNILAIETDKKIKQSMKEQFILRNKYTEGSMKVYKAAGDREIAKQDSVVGSISPYLQYHEDGDPIRKNIYGKANKAINSLVSSRGGNIKNVVLSKYRFNRMGRIGGTGNNRVGKYFMLKSKRNGISTIYERVHDGSRSSLVALRSLLPEKRVKARHFFRDSADSVLKSDKAFKGYSAVVSKVLDE